MSIFRNLLIANAMESSINVDGYQLQSLSISDGAYFDTGYYSVPNATDTHCYMSMDNNTTTTQGVFGSRVSNSVDSSSVNVFWNISSYRDLLRLDVLGGQVYSNDGEVTVGEIFEFKNNSQDKTVAINEIIYQGSTEMSAVRHITPYLIGNFYNNIITIYTTPCPMTIGSSWNITEWVDGVEVPQRSYVPWYRESDGVVCLKNTLDGSYCEIVTGTITGGLPVGYVPTFAEATWAEVDTIASSGNASDYWSIGDTKTFELSTGEEIEVRIADFNHDTLSTGGTAGITLEMTHALADTVTMNTTATNVGGWEESRLRTTDIPLRLAEFPTDLQAIIKPVKKLTQAGNMSSELTETVDSIWLFSYTEIGGIATAYSPSGEGTVYPLFVDNDSRIKNIGIDGSPDIWWTRSPYLGADTYFCYSTGGGATYRNNANTSRGVALGFCVGGDAV